MAKKVALKGLKSGFLNPVLKNTEAAYELGPAVALATLQELKKDDKKKDFSISADDGIYAAGADYELTELEVTVVELPLELEAKLQGGDFVPGENLYTARSTNVAPEFAFGYAALNMDGGYRLFRHPVVAATSIKVEHKTKGEGKEVATYTITFKSVARKIDNCYRDTKDVDANDNFEFIKAATKLPIAPGG